MFYMRKYQVLNKTTKKYFKMAIVQLWNLSTFIFLFWSYNTIFCTLTKNALKIFKLERKFKIKKLVASNMTFVQKDL